LQRWLFRLARDEQLPIVLGQRRIFIVPTRAGVLFAGVLAVMLIGAINYNLSLGHALIFLLAGLGLVAMVHTFHNLFGLRLTPGRAEASFAGDLARFPLQLENARRQSRRALEFSFGTSSRGHGRRSRRRARDRGRSLQRRQRRGRLDPGRVTLATRYPLGLFHAWSYPHPLWSCVVYPRPLRTPLPGPSPARTADHHHGDSGQEDFAGLRPRQPSDPTRHIAWKAVARRSDEQLLLVKQFAGGASDELWLDWSLTRPTAARKIACRSCRLGDGRRRTAGALRSDAARGADRAGAGQAHRARTACKLLALYGDNDP
jgi:uncharacterized protein (DUF58 family)